MRAYGLLSVISGAAGLIFRRRAAAWFSRMRLPGDTPSAVYWSRVVVPCVMLIALGAAMAFTR